jgi:heme/copper-type cytochrome/quinol oxidase subunit 2
VPGSLGTALFSVASAAVAGVRTFVASGETDLQQISPLMWVMVAISATGAIITFSFLVYALWKYRDPKVKHRPYG